MPAPALATLLWTAGTVASAITLDNEAGLPAATVRSIHADFDRWYARVYAYHQAAPTPVTLKLTRSVPFGFYRDGVVRLPPSEDRLAMVEDWVHELTHHVMGRDSSFFFREGMATHTVEALFGEDGRVPQGWPYFGRRCDDWVAVFVARDALLPLDEMLAWAAYRGATAEQDFRSWQIYLAAGSFVGWYRQRHGHAGLRQAFSAETPVPAAAEAQRRWLAWVRDRGSVFAPSTVLPASRRYQGYRERLALRRPPP